MEYSSESSSKTPVWNLPPAPPLQELENRLFSQGPYPRSVTEISGHSNSGKSYMAMHLVAKCIMPKQVVGMYNVGGCEKSAIYINCLQTFNVYEMAALVEGMIVAALRESECSRDEVKLLLHKHKLVIKSLKRLTVLRCHSFTDFMLCCRRLGKILKRNRDIKLVALDSINAFNSEGPRSARRLYRNLDKNLDYLTTETSNHAVTVIYTKCTLEYNKRQSHFDRNRKLWTSKDSGYYHLKERKYGVYPRRIPLTARFFLFEDDKKGRKGVLMQKGPVWYTYSKSGRLEWK